MTVRTLYLVFGFAGLFAMQGCGGEAEPEPAAEAPCPDECTEECTTGFFCYCGECTKCYDTWTDDEIKEETKDEENPDGVVPDTFRATKCKDHLDEEEDIKLCREACEPPTPWPTPPPTLTAVSGASPTPVPTPAETTLAPPNETTTAPTTATPTPAPTETVVTEDTDDDGYGYGYA